MPVPSFLLAPDLVVDTVGHGRWCLTEDVPPQGTFIAFVTDITCKITRHHLKELDDRIGDFAIRGVRMVAISPQGPAASRALVQEMQLTRLPVGHSVDPVHLARDWGMTAPQGQSGSGHIWVRSNGDIGVAALYSHPALLADATPILRAIDARIAENQLRAPQQGMAE